jgi:hypothetical protein
MSRNLIKTLSHCTMMRFATMFPEDTLKKVNSIIRYLFWSGAKGATREQAEASKAPEDRTNLSVNQD